MPNQVLFFPVSTFLASVSKSLRDEYGVQFSPMLELLPLLNDACAEIVNHDEVALVKNVPLSLTPFTMAVNAAGQGFAQGDTINLAGGSYTGSPIQLVVAGASPVTGSIDMVAVASFAQGAYRTYPPNPIGIANTSGGGTGATFTMTLAGPRQEIPPDGAALVEIRRNLGVDGQTLGPVITKASRDDMDAARPDWPMDVCGVNGMLPYIVHYMLDDRDPKRFYPWPMPNVMASPWYVESIYRAVPDDVVGMNDAFPLPALYQPAAKYYVIAHAMMRLDQDDDRWKKCQALYPIFLELFKDSVSSADQTTINLLPKSAASGAQ